MKWKKEIIFNKWSWPTWLSTCRRMQIYRCLLPCTEFKFKWINVLKIKPTILNLIEEKMWSTFEHAGTGDLFLNTTLVAQTMRETINGTSRNWDASVKQRTWSTRQNDSLLNGKGSSETAHHTEDLTPKCTEEIIILQKKNGVQT